MSAGFDAGLHLSQARAHQNLFVIDVYEVSDIFSKSWSPANSESNCTISEGAKTMEFVDRVDIFHRLPCTSVAEIAA